MDIKKISKVIGLTIAGVFFSANVLANAASDYAAKKDDMIKSLNLTPEQQTEVERIMNESHSEREAIMKKYADMPQGPKKMRAMRPDVEALHEKTDIALSQVLNDEQMETLMQFQDEILANAKAQMKANR